MRDIKAVGVLGGLLLAIVMVYDDADRFARNEWLEFCCQTSNQGCIIVNGKIGNHVDRDTMLFLKVIETMNLDDLRVLG